jgi:hypothetical protein
MNKKSWKICLIIVFVVNTVYSQQNKTLPSELRGNWFLQANTNEWIVGFYEKLVYFQNNFWSYQIISKTDSVVRFSLQKGKTSFPLSVIIKSDSVVQLEANSVTRLLIKSRRHMASLNSASVSQTQIAGKGVAWIRGYVDHRDMTSIKKIEFRTKNLLLGEWKIQAAEVNESGQFNLQILLKGGLHKAIFQFGGVFEYVMLRPGDTAIIYFDLLPYQNAETESEIRNTDSHTVFSGTIGSFNNEYRNYVRYVKKWDDRNEQAKMIRNSEQNQYKEYELKRKRIADSLLLVYEAQFTMSGTLKEVIQQTNKHSLPNALLRYMHLHNPPERVKLSPEYLELPNSFMVDDPKAYLAESEFDGFINEVRNQMVVNHLSDVSEVSTYIDANFSLAKFLDYTHMYNSSLTDAELLIMDTLIK